MSVAAVEIDQRLKAKGFQWYMCRKEKTERTKEECLVWLKSHSGQRPSTGSKAGANQNRLGQAFNQYIWKKGLQYDPDFVKAARALGWQRHKDLTKQRKKDCLKWLKRFRGKQPSTTAKDTYQRRLGLLFSGYVKSGWNYDPEFIKSARAIGWLPSAERTNLTKKQCLAWLKDHDGQQPSFTRVRIRASNEKYLGKAFSNFISEGNPRYDRDFVKAARALGWRPNGRGWPKNRIVSRKSKR